MSPMLIGGPFMNVAGGGGFPDDTELFIRYAQAHYTPMHPTSGFNEGFTIFPPVNAVRTGLGRDMLIMIVSGAQLPTTAGWPSGDDFFGPNGNGTLSGGWYEPGTGGLWRRTVGNTLKTNIFQRQPDGTALDNFIVPAVYQTDPLLVMQVVLGQNRNIPGITLNDWVGIDFGTDPDTTWSINSGTYGAAFRQIELLFGHRQTTKVGVGNHIAAPLVSAIDSTGGWLQMASAGYQDEWTWSVNDYQYTSWLTMWGRYVFSSPDADSSKARTIGWSPAITNVQYFNTYARFETGT